MSKNTSLYSANWYRVGHLKPQLQPHIDVQRNEYRGLIWYILHDPINGRSHRFNATAYLLIGAMDGVKTLDDIWNQVSDRLGEFAPSQDELIQIISRLFEADAIKMDVAAEAEDYLQRSRQREAGKRRQKMGNPLAVRIALWDPDEFLCRVLPYLAWMFQFKVFVVWLLFVLVAGLLALANSSGISLMMATTALDPLNLVFIAALYPPVKLLHELGHGLATRHYGGEVHELGVTLLMFMPVPYVDVSSANSVRSRRQRVVIGAAGIMVELFLAGIGLILFLVTSPGILHQLGFNMMLIGGISSLLFNGNPLLRYDGYFILSDSVAIPNLYQRASSYVFYLLQRYIFGVDGLHSPASAPGERGWFLAYAVASTSYRLLLLWWIVGFLVDTYFLIGVLLAGWVIGSQVLWPLVKGLRFLGGSPVLRDVRVRAVALSSVSLALLILALFWMPASSYTRAQGVLSLPENAILRAGTDGILGEFQVAADSELEQGVLVVSVSDPELESMVSVLESRLQELNSEYRSAWDDDRVEADNLKEQMKVLAAELKDAKARVKSRNLISQTSGRLVVPDMLDLPGSYVRKGQVIGYILDDSPPIARVAVDQDDIGSIQSGVDQVELKLVSNPARTWSAEISRSSPEGTFDVPHLALTRAYGGWIPAIENEKGDWQSQEKLFIVDVEFHPDSLQGGIGQRIHVRFDHGKEPVGHQWYRRLRQTFLGRING